MRGAITRKTVIQPRQGSRSAVLQRLNDGLSFLDLARTSACRITPPVHSKCCPYEGSGRVKDW